MKLAILLITCDRPKYTEHTLTSFSLCNSWCGSAPYPVSLVHIDDASQTDENLDMADAAGFRLLRRMPTRAGNTPTRKTGIRLTVQEVDPTHIMLLENDWECQREMPWKLIAEIMEHPEHDIYHLRLWHHFKSKQKYDSWDKVTPLVSRGHAGRGRADPGWTPLAGLSEPADVGDIHWGAPPAVTRVEELLRIHHKATSEHDSILASGKITARTAQVKENVFFHIGEQRTPRFQK